jgi:hypothetical protein
MIIYLIVCGIIAVALVTWAVWPAMSVQRAIERRASESRAAAIEILRTLNERTD